MQWFNIVYTRALLKIKPSFSKLCFKNICLGCLNHLYFKIINVSSLILKQLINWRGHMMITLAFFLLIGFINYQVCIKYLTVWLKLNINFSSKKNIYMYQQVFRCINIQQVSISLLMNQKNLWPLIFSHLLLNTIFFFTYNFNYHIWWTKQIIIFNPNTTPCKRDVS